MPNARPFIQAMPNQAEFLNVMCTQPELMHVILNWACAAGKTIAIQSWIQYALELGILKHVVILVPNKIIRQSWATIHLAPHHRVLRVGGVEFVVCREGQDVPLIQEIGGADIRQRLVDYMNHPSPGYAIATCSQSWTNGGMEAVLASGFDPERLKDMLFVFDEHHLTAARELSRVFRWVASSGARTIGATATMYRLDNRSVRQLNGRERIFVWTHLDQVDHGRAPKDLDLEFRPIDLQLDVTLDVKIRRVATALVEAIVRDGHAPDPEKPGEIILPKFVIQVPGQRRRRSEWREWQEILGEEVNPSVTYEVVRLIIDLLKDWMGRHGHPSQQQDMVLNITDDPASEHRRSFNRILSGENRASHWTHSRVLGVIGSKRTTMGMNWRWASHVYRLGISQSLADTIQLVGRGQRGKNPPSNPEQHDDFAGYPPSYRNMTGFRALIPMRRDGTTDHLDAVIKMALALVGLTHGNLFARLLHRPPSTSSGVEPRERGTTTGGRRSPPSPPVPSPTPAIVDALVGIGQDVESATTMSAALLAVLPAEGGLPVSECHRRLLQHGLNEDQANTILAHVLVSAVEGQDSTLNTALSSYPDGRLEINPRDVVLRAFAELVEDSRDIIVKFRDVPGFVRAERELVRFDATMLHRIRRDFLRQLREFDLEVVAKAVQTYRTQYGRDPAPHSTEMIGDTEDTWADLHRATLRGSRRVPADAKGLPGLLISMSGRNEYAALEHIFGMDGNPYFDGRGWLEGSGFGPLEGLIEPYRACRHRLGLTSSDILKIEVVEHENSNDTVRHALLHIMSIRPIVHATGSVAPRLRALGRSLQLRVQSGKCRFTRQELVQLRNSYLRTERVSVANLR